MKAITLIEMLEDEKYQTLTVAEFAAIVRRSGVLEEDIEPDNELAWLESDFTPTSVIHYTNKED